MAICKKDFVFIFIILLRSLGIQCRLVINLATVPIRPLAKDLCVISTKVADEPKSSDNAKKVKKSTKKGDEPSSDKNKEKDVKASKPKTKVEKLKSLVNSISGKKSEILSKSPETLSQKESKNQAALKSTANSSSDKPDDAKKKNLKRSVSVQSISSVNDNNKRSRITKTGPSDQNIIRKDASNDNSKKILKRHGMSLQRSSSINNVSRMSLNNPTSDQLMKTKAANSAVVASPVSRRTRAAFTRSARSASATSTATATSQSIPQLDGGNDVKSKKQKPELLKFKIPLRARSVSPSSAITLTQRRSTSVVPRGRAKSNLLRIRLPSTSRSMSKSPTSTSGHISRKSKFEKTALNVSSPSSKLEEVSKTNNIHTEEQKKSAEKLKPVQPSSKSSKLSTLKNAVKADASLSAVKVETNSGKKMSSNAKEQQEFTKTDKIPSSSKSRKLSISTDALSPVKLESSSGIKFSSDAKGQKKNNKKDKPEPVQSLSKSSKLSTSKAAVKATAPLLLSPVKLASNSDKNTSSTTKDSISDQKPKTSNRTATASSSSTSAQSSKPVATSMSKKKSKQIERSTTVEKSTKNTLKRKSTNSASSDSDFVPTPKKKSSPAIEKPLPRQVEKLKKRIDRRILSTDDESIEPTVKKNEMNYWIEVYCEAESKWICIDLFKAKVNCVDEIKVSYVRYVKQI